MEYKLNYQFCGFVILFIYYGFCGYDDDDDSTEYIFKRDPRPFCFIAAIPYLCRREGNVILFYATTYLDLIWLILYKNNF